MLIIVSAFLFVINFPWINRVNELIIHSMYLESNSLRSSITTSLKDCDFGNVILGLATDLLNFWQTLQSLTTRRIVFQRSEDIHSAFM